jgi:hypothetical protein
MLPYDHVELLKRCPTFWARQNVAQRCYIARSRGETYRPIRIDQKSQPVPGLEVQSGANGLGHGDLSLA